MLDTMTFTKSLGAICGSLLVFLLGGWAAESLYHTGGHGEQEQAYTIDTGEDDAPAEAEEEAEVPFMEVLASAMPDDGESLFNQCRACHQLEKGANGVGPHLYAVVGRDMASVEGFSYSDALASLDASWTPEELDGFLAGPQDYAPGTSMGYSGMDDVEDRANLIAYLSTVGGEFTPPEVEEAAAEDTDEGDGAEVADAETGETDSTEADEGSEADETAAAEDGATDEPAAESGDDTAESAVDIAAGDAAAGEGVYRQCAACHRLEEGQNAVGPHLAGIVGREIGSVEEFNYSDALSGMDGAWTAENLDGFIENPMEYASGTSMAYPGVRDETDRLNLLAFLAAQDTAAADDASDGDATGDEAADEPAAEETADEEGSEDAAPAAEDTQDATSEDGGEAGEAAAEDGPADDGAADESTDDGADAGESAPADDGGNAAENENAEATDAEADAGATQVAGDPAAGEGVYRQCAACHRTEEGQNAVGPHLADIVGRDIAAVDGFNYSEALTSLDGAWTPEQLDGWLANPREFAPGNRMGYPGVRDATDRENLIAYLATLGN